jgi:hypothetical protein
MECDTHRKAIAMKQDLSRSAFGSEKELAEPGYWLVFGLEWPDGAREAEAALAVAPELILRDGLSRHAYQVLGCADLYADKRATCVVFLSDLTQMFASAGYSWDGMGVDWQLAVDELRGGPYPAMFLTISERAHLLICDPAVGRGHAGQESGDNWTGAERELVRRAVAEKLAADWPIYMDTMIKSGWARIAR